MRRVQQDLAFVFGAAVHLNLEGLMKVPEFEFLKFVTVAIRENVIEIIDFFGVLAAVVLVAVFFTLDRIHDAFDILVDDDLY